MFLQIHFLTSYHASLLNRDDAGLAKRISFGGAPRLRISSQSQKRHWRQWMLTHTDIPSGLRSRHLFDRVIFPRLVEAGVDPALATDLIKTLAGYLLTSTDKKPLDDHLAMKQPILFGRPEAEFFIRLLADAARQGDVAQAHKYLEERLKTERANFQALLRQAGVENPSVGFEGAMFGRFVTSDILSRVDAPVHVAHAFTTQGLDSEVDFFTVVDDLANDAETGAAHANDMELAAGIFYGYVVVDIPLLVSNLTGNTAEQWRQQDLRASRELLNLLVHAIAEVTPGAKLGATAPYARADCVILELGDSQPRSFANAFLRPVASRSADPMAASISALSDYVTRMEAMYGDSGEVRRVSSVHPWPRLQDNVKPLQSAIDEILAYVTEG